MAAAAADDWVGELCGVPGVLALIVAAFVAEGVQLRAKNKAAGEKWGNAKRGWSDRLAAAIMRHMQNSEAGQLLLAGKYAGAGAAADLSARLNGHLNNWQKGNTTTPQQLKAAATAAGLKCWP